MRYVVAVKQVPDSGLVEVNGDGSLRRAGVPAVLNPYCEYALGRILDSRLPGDEVTVVTMGPPQASAVLRRCMELGADSAYLVSDPALAGSDTWATARALTAFIQRHIPDADLLVFGRQTVDGDTGQVPYEVAQLLGVQQFAYVTELELSGDGITAVQDYGDMRRRCTVPRGSVVAFSGVDPRGRFASVSGRLAAAGRGIVTVDRVALGLGLYSVGTKGSPTVIEATRRVESTRRNRKVVIRDPATAAGLILGEAGAR